MSSAHSATSLANSPRLVASGCQTKQLPRFSWPYSDRPGARFAATMSNRSDFSRLTRLITSLKALKQEIRPEREGAASDPLEAQKNKLVGIVADIKADIELLRTLQNPRDLIERKAELRNSFNKSQEEIKKFSDLIMKAAKDKKTKDAAARAHTVKRMSEWLELVQQELMSLAEEARDVKVDGIAGFDAQARTLDRREAQRARRQQRRDRRRQRGGDDGGGGGDDGDGIYLEDMQPASDNERAFMMRVEQSRKEEEELLQLISEGLYELHQMSLQLNKLLKQSSQQIDMLDDKMRDVQERFDTTNKKLDELLEQSGGCNRWCPICICVVLILACVGFLVIKFTK